MGGGGREREREKEGATEEDSWRGRKRGSHRRGQFEREGAEEESEGVKGEREGSNEEGVGVTGEGRTGKGCCKKKKRAMECGAQKGSLDVSGICEHPG